MLLGFIILSKVSPSEVGASLYKILMLPGVMGSSPGSILLSEWTHSVRLGRATVVVVDIFLQVQGCCCWIGVYV